MQTRRERLTAPLSWWLTGLLFAVVWGWIALVVGGWTAAAVTTLCVALLIGAATWRYGVLIVAAPDGLTAGRAHLETTHIGAVTPLGPSETRELLGPQADARAWLLLRPYVDTAVRVDVLDPADPTPYWVVSTRDPSALARALGVAPEPR